MDYLQLFVLSIVACTASGQITGTLRLLDTDGQSGVILGRLEVYLNGQWGTLCTDGFDERDAQVACRQLGFDNYRFEGRAINQLLVDSNEIPIWLNVVNCTGSETRLIDCPQHNGTFTCDHSSDVALVCAYNGHLRFVNPFSNSGLPPSGRLEILHDRVWGTVCADRFSDTDASVACSQMGYTEFTRYGNVTDFAFPEISESIPIWLDEVNCQGDENRLIECPANRVGDEDCEHSQDIVLFCSITPTTTALTTPALTTPAIDLGSNPAAIIGGGIAGGVVVIIIVIAVIIIICAYVVKKSLEPKDVPPVAVAANMPTGTVVIPDTTGVHQSGGYQPPPQKHDYYHSQPVGQGYDGGYPSYLSHQQAHYTGDPTASLAPGPGDPTLAGVGAPPTFMQAPPPAYSD